MTFEHLANLFQNWGYEIKPHHYPQFRDYLMSMMRKRRVMIAWDGDRIQAVITFFLTNDYDPYYRRSMWSIPEDDPQGSQIYIDKMVCARWTPSIRKSLQSTIEKCFPNVMEGYYHRGPNRYRGAKDHRVKIYRRGVKSHV